MGNLPRTTRQSHPTLDGTCKGARCADHSYRPTHRRYVAPTGPFSFLLDAESTANDNYQMMAGLHRWTYVPTSTREFGDWS